MKILKDGDLIEVGDILMFAGDDKHKELVTHVLVAQGYAGMRISDDYIALALRMSSHERKMLANKLNGGM